MEFPRNLYYVYVLLSFKDSKLYIGFTTNLERRFRQHSSGQTISTKSRRPFKLLFYEAYISRSDAERREKYFTKQHQGKEL